MTWIVYDRVSLTEPYIKSADCIAAPGGTRTATFSVAPPDRNPGRFGNVFAQCLAREEIARGGAETALPEYRDKLKR